MWQDPFFFLFFVLLIANQLIALFQAIHSCHGVPPPKKTDAKLFLVPVQYCTVCAVALDMNNKYMLTGC